MIRKRRWLCVLFLGGADRERHAHAEGELKALVLTLFIRSSYSGGNRPQATSLLIRRWRCAVKLGDWWRGATGIADQRHLGTMLGAIGLVG